MTVENKMITNLMALTFLYQYIKICGFEFVHCIYLGGKVYNGQLRKNDNKFNGIDISL